MSKIITNITSLIAEKLNKDYSVLKNDLELLERKILETELQLSNYEKTRIFIKKKLTEIELQIIDSIFKEKK